MSYKNNRSDRTSRSMGKIFDPKPIYKRKREYENNINNVNSANNDDDATMNVESISNKSILKSRDKTQNDKMNVDHNISEDEIDIIHELAIDVERCDPFSSSSKLSKSSISKKNKIAKSQDDEDEDNDYGEPSKKKFKINEGDVIAEIENILECELYEGEIQYHIKWIGNKIPTWISEDDFIEKDILNEFKLYEKNRNDPNLQRKAYIYCRTSRRNAIREVSLYDQEKYCLEFAKKNNINIIGVFKDNGISAKDMKNQFALNFICNRIQKGECILFYDISRFSRSMMQALEQLEHLRKDIGAIAHSCHDGLTWNDIATNRNNFRQNLSNSQLHSEMISERILSSIDYRRERGDHIGYVPYGYKTDFIDGVKKLVPNKAEQTVITKIIDEATNVVIKQLEDIDISKGDKNSNQKRQNRTKKNKSKSKQKNTKITKKRLYSKMIDFTPKEYRSITSTINTTYTNRNGKPFTWYFVRKIINNWGNNLIQII